MQKERLAAFSDGVFAIIITIMVLELKVPHEPTLAALTGVLPVFLSYVLSFLYVAIYWNNHHHLLHAATHINGPIMWANMHLLFWLSLIPFSTGWMGENQFASLPTAFYGVSLLMPAIALLHSSKSHYSPSGFIEIDNLTELYFTRNAVVSGNFDELEPGMIVQVTRATDEGPMGPQASSVRLLDRSRTPA
jgi:uncharacterized membrane protein